MLSDRISTYAQNLALKIMPILFSPDGQSVEVSELRVKSYLKEGYKTQLLPDGSFSQLPSVLRLVETLGTVDLNNASLKEILALPEIGTALAKRVISGRPFASVEDAIAKFPEINWFALTSLIKIDPVANAD